jgi:hypothetical protein
MRSLVTTDKQSPSERRGSKGLCIFGAMSRRTKILLIALAIIALGGVQVAQWRTGERSRASSIGTASGMFAIFSGVAIGIYGMAQKEKR